VDIEVEWQWGRINSFSVVDWHHVISLRQAVFVVEQDCPYLDADVLDLESWHLVAWSVDKGVHPQALGYLRVIDPGAKYAEASIGRLLTQIDYRNKGLGRALMSSAIGRIEALFPGQLVRISAQEHLRKFYEHYGFRQVGDGYDEDGIPHIEMISDLS